MLDAGALTLLAKSITRMQELFLERYEKGLSYPILTPHPGEFKRMAPSGPRQTVWIFRPSFRERITWFGAERP